jgi:hypothetical protein
MRAVLTSTGITMWQLARLSRQDDTNKDIVVSVGSTKIPRSYHLRIVIFALTCCCFSISTVSQTFFTNFLVEPGLHNQIANLHDLSHSKTEYAITPGKKFNYDIENALTNLTDTGYQC